MIIKKLNNYAVRTRQDLFNFKQRIINSLAEAPINIVKTTAFYASFGFSYGTLYGANLIDVNSSRQINAMIANQFAELIGSHRRTYYSPDLNDEMTKFYNFIQPFYEASPTTVAAYATTSACLLGTLGFFKSAKDVYEKMLHPEKTNVLAKR